MIRRGLGRAVTWACVLICAAGVAAHPGRGIVVDGRGRVYVADAVRSVIWRIEPTGAHAELAKGVHGHWLSLTDDGAILADHERYDAEAATFPRGLRRIGEDGGISTVVSDRPDPHGLDAGAFTALERGFARVRDSSGVLEFVGGAERPGIDLSSLDGNGTVNAIVDLPDGSLVGVKDRTIFRVPPEARQSQDVAVVATIEKDRTADGPPIASLSGVAMGESGAVLTADPSSRRVLSVSTQGEVSVVHISTSPWFPTGVATKGVTVYVLEHGLEGERTLGPRVIVVEPDGTTRTLATIR